MAHGNATATGLGIRLQNFVLSKMNRGVLRRAHRFHGHTGFLGAVLVKDT